MAYNIEFNYYNGTAYQTLYPKGIFSNMDGSLTTNQIPSLSTSKITSGILDTSLGGTGVTSYSALANKLSGYMNSGSNIKCGYYRGTGVASPAKINVGITPKLFMLFPTKAFNQIDIYTIAYYIIWYTGNIYNDIPTINLGLEYIEQKEITITLSNTTFSILRVGVNGSNIYNDSNSKYIWIAFG